jgi:hypothetical protein
VLNLGTSLGQKLATEKLDDVEIVGFNIFIGRVKDGLQANFKITFKLNTGETFKQEMCALYNETESTPQFSSISFIS